jgi:hypothetical protein
MGFDCDGYEKLSTWERGEESIKKDTWISGRARNIEKKN